MQKWLKQQNIKGLKSNTVYSFVPNCKRDGDGGGGGLKFQYLGK